MDTSLPRGILIDIPGRGSLHVTHLILDFNGTIAKDGALLPAVEERLNQLSQQLEVIVLTADTYGTASQVLSHLPVKLKVISTGEDKKKLLTVILKKNNSSSIAAIGNGSNDAAMLRHADLGIAVFGPEGTSCELLRVANVLAWNIQDALDLLLHPKRLIGTLRP